ncbi:MAG: UMP kinase [Desulfobulbaceae bacterium A2]|nr:MAG: UMP kinase [Desulfobulbaceae bacterium A2]
MAYRRVLLKLSGEALMGRMSHGLCPETLAYVAREIRNITEGGTQLGIVIGAGNIFRGLAGASQGMHRPTADAMGMLATVINCLALADALNREQVPARVLSALPVGTVCEPYGFASALDHLEQGRVVICAAGTGNPYFTTDTAAVLRALEIQAELVMKATRVDGVYDCDPEKCPGAVRFARLTPDEVLARNLRVMDATAIALLRDTGLPLLVFNMTLPGNIERAIRGEAIGTLVAPAGDN